MNRTGVPRNVAYTVPCFGTGSNPARKSEDMTPSGANKQAAFINITKAVAFGTNEKVRQFMCRQVTTAITNHLVSNGAMEHMQGTTHDGRSVTWDSVDVEVCPWQLKYSLLMCFSHGFAHTPFLL